MSIDTDELSDFMQELANSDTAPPERVQRDIKEITSENMAEVLLTEIAGVLSTCKEVSETLADRISAGDNYEGTMMGFAQATDNLMKSLKFLDKQKSDEIKHQRELEKIEKAHECRLVEIEKRGGTGNKEIETKNVTNVFVGSHDEFLKKATQFKEKQKTIDV